MAKLMVEIDFPSVSYEELATFIKEGDELRQGKISRSHNHVHIREDMLKHLLGWRGKHKKPFYEFRLIGARP